MIYFYQLLVKCLWVILYASSMMSIAHPATQRVYSLDVYRSKQLTREQLISLYSNDFTRIAREVLHNDQAKWVKSIQDVTERIDALGKFAFIGVSPTLYPHDSTIHITVDVVDQEDSSRLAYLKAKPMHDMVDTSGLLAKWKQYQEIGLNKIWLQGHFSNYKSCPAFHCLFGFEEPEYRPYKQLFLTNVPPNKALLIRMLRHDKNIQDRVASAYLLAHLKSGEEVIEALTPSISDVSSEVRNSVMRVLAMTLMKVRTKNFPINEMMAALDYPVNSDRNKALLVVESLASDKRYQQDIIKRGGARMVSLLQQTQPNVHEPVYRILKKLSHQSYSDTDVNAWKKWVDTHQP
ncbi:MAG: hypothetical protein A3E85_00630 [Gammaproteobacteria bacterium RIFCSPHIGHO2_12_FULL_45_12]|nr:MAG: hypothetical protein A3E85_00630 [Gammaproteobacteria bacterium RIFCSPHIGHO2_12_FULL_45_12]